MLSYFYKRLVKDLNSFPALIIAAILATKIFSLKIIILATLANYLLMVVAFIYNDIEDRVEDAKSHKKRFKNPFSFHVLSLNQGYLIITLISLVSLIISYRLGGTKLLFIAASNLLVSILYSYKKFRLKSVPLIDLLSHSYMLASVQILYFMSLPQAVNTTSTLLVLLGVTAISIGGSLYNQQRDYEDDTKASIKNTASIIGKDLTFKLAKLTYLSGFLIVILGLIK